MAHVYLDGSVKAKIRIAQGNQVTDLMSSGWTDERHTDYISSMEASFINRLYNHGNNADKKDPGANGFKVLQRGAVVWKKVEFERPNACAQVGAKQSPPASRWIQRFTSRDCSSSAGGDGAETSVGDHESGIRTIPGGTPLFHRRELGACKGENLLNENSEGSDQNFADDDEAEVDEESSKACKKRRLSSSSTYCPQMTKLQVQQVKLHAPEEVAVEKAQRHGQGKGMAFDLNCTLAQEEDILQDDMNMEEEIDFDLNCTPAQEEDILQDDMNMEEEMDFDLNCTPAQEEDILQDDMNMEEEEEGISPGHDAVGELQYSCHEQSVVHL
ncbi:cold-regulated protein 27-like isoform X1 [Hordeum vulgare subsp. vulgare]|uniref:Uncharacterized protein n=3 Tax=Hordeum vulgare subsp. vulgare TaxID=112509 RepID=A0A8I6XHY6_HORVV|nr:cold-regulated protein 27-like isoform X1 [Hordeum vulgare subsp. vulgare]